DQDLGAIEAAEQRAVTEQLAGRFQALVVHFGGWLPDPAPALAVIDPAALAAARQMDRAALLHDLRTRTVPGGVHLILPAAASREVIPLAPASLQAEYQGWQISGRRGRGGKQGMGFVAIKPPQPRQLDTALNVSE
ncbi:MAG: hypothetical protein ACREMG_14910, partial [Gemmatimonadales bacterium]